MVSRIWLALRPSRTVQINSQPQDCSITLTFDSNTIDFFTIALWELLSSPKMPAAENQKIELEN